MTDYEVYQAWCRSREALKSEARAARDTPPRATVDRWAVARAHHGFGHGFSTSGEHLVVLHPLVAGRLVRQAGDALCKPAAKFWNLDIAEVHTARENVTCRRCREIAGRLGVDLDRPSEAQS